MSLSTVCHPFVDGLIPRIHVDVLTEFVETSVVETFESSFDDTGDVFPRPGAVPFAVVSMHGKEENEEQADGMKRTSYAIGQKRGPSYASYSSIYAPRSERHELHMEAEVPPSSKKTETAQPENLGRGRGETGETDRT